MTFSKSQALGGHMNRHRQGNCITFIESLQFHYNLKRVIAKISYNMII